MDNKSLDVIIDKLPAKIKKPLERCKSVISDKVTEITFRAFKPVCIYLGSDFRFLTINGTLTDDLSSDRLIITDMNDIENTVLRLCDYSIYAYQNEINSGFITISNGVRVGLSGRAVTENNTIINIRDICSLNFRVPRDIVGCSNELLGKIDPLSGVLICGEPSSGKTTLIRDLARSLSYHYRVSVLDERDEFSAICRGISGFDIGLCDVFSGYPKREAAVSAVRSMAPEIIVCDEVGDDADVIMITNALRCGVAFIASLHASSLDDLRSRKAVADMIASSAFGHIVFMSGRDRPGRIEKIYEMRGRSA